MKTSQVDAILEVWNELRLIAPGYVETMPQPLIKIGRLKGEIAQILSMIISIGDYLNQLEK